jgi:hypothetical protein
MDTFVLFPMEPTPVKNPLVLLLIVSLTTLLPAKVQGQLPMLEGLFKSVTDVHLFGTAAWFANRPPALAGGMHDGEPTSGTLTGLGFEVSFQVGEFSPRNQTSAKKKPATTVAPDSQAGASPVDPDNRWLAELAIGYTELRDFESAVPTLDVFGAIRELPAVSLYFSHLPAGEDTRKLTWYLGVRTGLAQLQGLRAYVGAEDDGTPDQIYSGGGSTFQFGLVTGADIDLGSVDLFLEPGYTYRPFSSVEWEGIDGTISEALPRDLDMSTWGISLGAQIGIGAASD